MSSHKDDSRSGSSTTRARILDAARQLLEEQGPGGAALKDIAAAANVSRQAIYLHFENRTGLMVAMVQHVDAVEGLSEAARAIGQQPTAITQIDAAIDVLCRFAPRIHRIASVMDAARLSDPAMAAAFRDRMESRRASFRQIFAGLEAEGWLRPEWTAERAADAFWTLSNPKSYSDLVVDAGWTLDEYRDYLTRVTRATFLRELG